MSFLEKQESRIYIKPFRIPRAWVILLLGLLLCASLLSGCAEVSEILASEESRGPTRAGTPSALEPRGPAAAEIASLWWLMFALGTVIYIGVMVYLLAALFRRRREKSVLLSVQSERRVVLLAGALLPLLVILVLFGFTIQALSDISTPDPPETLAIDVTGYQWWWEVYYPEQPFTTANEIHIPVGQPVLIRLTSHDVIHSFWVPQLHGKLDANPDRTTTFWLQADEPGEYWGECAEFCGVQHARMRILVVAQEPDQFAAWLEAQSLPMRVPEDSLAQRGLEVFLGSNCVFCHTIEGTNATGALGPNLTHVGSRRTLGAGTIDNTIGNMGGWVSNPQDIKPGVLMPASELSGEDLHALINFLEGLE